MIVAVSVFTALPALVFCLRELPTLFQLQLIPAAYHSPVIAGQGGIKRLTFDLGLGAEVHAGSFLYLGWQRPCVATVLLPFFAAVAQQRQGAAFSHGKCRRALSVWCRLLNLYRKTFFDYRGKQQNVFYTTGFLLRPPQSYFRKSWSQIASFSRTSGPKS
jgi:hypothetical protein